jgi:Leucine-rich repeat (LRR) protein
MMASKFDKSIFFVSNDCVSPLNYYVLVNCFVSFWDIVRCGRTCATLHVDENAYRLLQINLLPVSLNKLNRNCLLQIDLSHNALRELPEAMGEMESLQRLNLSHNKLKTLPLSLGNSSHLKLILCDGNRLDSPPQSVCDEGSAGTLQYLRKQVMVSSC